jgi:SOS-response transcriptional repressor LexA
MEDELAVTSLLRALKSDGVDANVLNLCKEADRLRRQGHIDESVARAKDAVSLARTTGSFVANGVAFLYLGAARHSSSKSAEYTQTIADCKTAIAWLDRTGHNCFVAQAIQARLFQDRGTWRAAVEHYRRAIRTLDGLIEYHNKRGQTALADEYEKWRSRVQACVQHLEIPQPYLSVTKEYPMPQTVPNEPPSPSSLTTMEPGISPKTEEPLAFTQAGAVPPVAEEEPDAATFPGYLLELKMIPIYSASAHAGSAEELFELPVEDYLDLNQFIIRGKPYLFEPAQTKVVYTRVISLSRDQSYIIVEVIGDSMEPALREGEFVLVKQQNHHDYSGQIVIVHSGRQNVHDPVKYIIKRIREKTDGIWLESDNAKYGAPQASDTDAQYELVGVVVGRFYPAL